MPNYYKIGCRWSDDGESGTQIQDVFQNYQAVFIGKDRNGAALLDKVKPNDRIAITDGVEVIGIALIKSDKMPLDSMNIPKEFHHTNFNFDHHNNLIHAIGFRALVMMLDPVDRVSYIRGAFCQIHETNIISHVENMCKKYKIL